VNETIPPDIVQIPLKLPSIDNVTLSPESAVADGAYVGPPTTAALGAVEVNVIAWGVDPAKTAGAVALSSTNTAAKVPTARRAA